MPGTYAVDQAQTFANPPLLLASGPKMKFDAPGQQDVSATGEKKWECDLAATFPPPQPGMKATSEVIKVTITGPAADPGEHIPAGSPVHLDGFRVGVSAPEKRGENRIIGGKLWFQATGLRQAHVQAQRGDGKAA